MEIFLICLVLFLLIVAIMSIGLLKGRSVRGTCGGAGYVCSMCGEVSVLPQKKKVDITDL
jgi:hypothetical protein